MTKEELLQLFELLRKFYELFYGDNDGSSEASDVNTTIGEVLYKIENCTPNSDGLILEDEE